MTPATRLHFDRQRGVVQITLEGRHTDQTIKSALDAAMSSIERAPGVDRLWDIRNADLEHVDARGLWRMTQHVAALPPGLRDVRVAIVAATDRQFGLARMGEALAEGKVPTSWQVFRTVREAEAWLAEP